MAPVEAIVVTDAGQDEANGLYVTTGKTHLGAPIFENDQKCILSRESLPDKRKGGALSNGWILGQGLEALYGVLSEAVVPPATGWLHFGGRCPCPKIESKSDIAEAAVMAAKSLNEQGSTMFSQGRWIDADAIWERAVGLAELYGGDEALQAALYTNRAEARLRQQRWEAALCFAEAALALRPTFGKALLCAALAAKELGKASVAVGYAKSCLDANPKSSDAVRIYEEAEGAAQAAQNALARIGPERATLKDIMKKDGDQAEIPKTFDAKDANSKKGFGAFKGYYHIRKDAADECTPLSEMPHHFMGFPEEKVAELDAQCQAARDRKDELKRLVQQDKGTNYASIKEEYKWRTKEDFYYGKVPSIEEEYPSERIKKAKEAEEQQMKPLQKEVQRMLNGLGGTGEKGKAQHAPLPKLDKDQIDSLFKAFSGKPASNLVASLASSRKKQLKKARELMSGPAKVKVTSDALMSGALMGPAKTSS